MTAEAYAEIVNTQEQAISLEDLEPKITFDSWAWVIDFAFVLVKLWNWNKTDVSHVFMFTR